MKKRIVLCADDYGQAPAISQGIINLIEKGRLSATSCMVNTSFWTEHAKWLIPLQQQIDIGLHFNLTEGKALSAPYRQLYGDHFPSLGKLWRLASMRRLSLTAVEAELHAQLDSFQQALGILPSYLDGHQHIHQFPVVRAAVMNVYEKRLRQQHAYIRLVNESCAYNSFINVIKKIVIRLTGTSVLRKLLNRNSIPYNRSFAGIYSFSQSKQYPILFVRFLQMISDRGLIMCHPGLEDSISKDPISGSRYAEYLYFISNRFINDCQAQGVVIGRFQGMQR